jgi:hypothetical protein
LERFRRVGQRARLQIQAPARPLARRRT